MRYPFAGTTKMSKLLSDKRKSRRRHYVSDDLTNQFAPISEASVNQRMNAIKGGDLSQIKSRLGSVRRQPAVPAGSDS
jgi:hypothetical protein